MVSSIMHRRAPFAHNAIAPADAAQRRAKPAIVCYEVAGLPIVDMDRLFDARQRLVKIDDVIVPPRQAGTFRVPRGHFFRIVSVVGPRLVT